MPYYVKEEICLNSDRSAVVACDSPAAHYKLTPPFGNLDDEEAKKLGLVKADAPKKAEAEAPAEPAEEKAVAAPAENKAKQSAAKK